MLSDYFEYIVELIDGSCEEFSNLTDARNFAKSTVKKIIASVLFLA